MKILVFNVNFYPEDFEYKIVYNEEKFFDELVYKHYDVVIIHFSNLSLLLDVEFKGIVIFINDYVDEVVYKRALEVGDFLYTNEEIWKIPFRLKYIAKKFLNQKSNVFVFKDLIYNLKTKELYKNRELVKISPAKKDILDILIRNRDRFVSKEYILENSDNIDTISSIKVLISKLRQLGFDIENQKDFGYKLNSKENK